MKKKLFVLFLGNQRPYFIRYLQRKMFGFISLTTTITGYYIYYKDRECISKDTFKKNNFYWTASKIGTKVYENVCRWIELFLYVTFNFAFDKSNLRISYFTNPLPPPFAQTYIITTSDH